MLVHNIKLKSTQAWDNLDFFYLNQILICPSYIFEKISLLFLRFSPEFSKISVVTEHTRNQIFLMSYPKNFFSLNLRFGPNRWVPWRFLKMSIIYSQNLHFNLVFLRIFENYSMRMLSIRGNDFIAHTRNQFHRTLSIRGTNFRACSASSKMWTAFTCTIHAEHAQNEFCHTLSIRGTNFIACWAYAKPISSHAEHARKCMSNISAESNTIFKNLVLQALGTIWFRFLQKK